MRNEVWYVFQGRRKRFQHLSGWTTSMHIAGGSLIRAYNICTVHIGNHRHNWREWAARIDGWWAFASHLLMSSVNSCRHVFLLPFCLSSSHSYEYLLTFSALFDLYSITRNVLAFLFFLFNAVNFQPVWPRRKNWDGERILLRQRIIKAPITSGV